MSGGKGGSTTSEVKIPEYIEAAAQRNLNKAERISQLGYVPQYGPDVAAFTPMQQAGFQNTANMAGAFGMAAPTSQRDIMGGMDAPTQYAGGVSGYSSAPIFQQSVDALAAARPAQKSYIDSFFIDPTSGQYAYQPMDYTTISTMAQDQRQQAAANRANELDIARANAMAGPQTTIQNTTLTPVELSQYASTVGGANYNPSTDILTPEQRVVINSNTPEGTAARVAQEDLAMNVLADAGGGGDYSFDNPSPTGSYGGSLTTGQPSAANQAYFDSVNSGSSSSANANSGGGYTSIGDMFDGGGAGASGSTFGGALGGVSNAVGATPAGSGGGGYTSVGDMFDGGGPGASTSGGRDFAGPNPDGSAGNDGGGGGGGGGCVVATHAVESGAFTPHMKREAVVWCVQALHGKWWGEAVRRGYRHLGRKKIEQGKAREHYAEFRRYIEFANGKKRDARGALTFALRTAQFFAVGLVRKDA